MAQGSGHMRGMVGISLGVGMRTMQGMQGKRAAQSQISGYTYPLVRAGFDWQEFLEGGCWSSRTLWAEPTLWMDLRIHLFLGMPGYSRLIGRGNLCFHSTVWRL